MNRVYGIAPLMFVCAVGYFVIGLPIFGLLVAAGWLGYFIYEKRKLIDKSK